MHYIIQELVHPEKFLRIGRVLYSISLVLLLGGTCNQEVAGSIIPVTARLCNYSGQVDHTVHQAVSESSKPHARKQTRASRTL